MTCVCVYVYEPVFNIQSLQMTALTPISRNRILPIGRTGPLSLVDSSNSLMIQFGLLEVGGQVIHTIIGKKPAIHESSRDHPNHPASVAGREILRGCSGAAFDTKIDTSLVQLK